MNKCMYCNNQVFVRNQYYCTRYKKKIYNNGTKLIPLDLCSLKSQNSNLYEFKTKSNGGILVRIG
ncbi:hypothetical protein [Clostridium septicum]|uniref:Uncharacterized protein n=1 Tax=Clostridium septicum TaxID=1504 RepID=A0A9N7PM12_CLOSE|nr:hypothetical protein [Clostridium septicum]AYE35296.1 hypothetical protein CP523_13155 [Clostridium septicum]QAS60685.1 hypothetical protein EI377_08000 [Clostridium septicum]UEC20051.1 hypothetical protein LK444_11630 [Clostridium septicum]USS01893.1 hypothetical protein NH397_05540 [Clostridium septicum]